MIRSDTDDLWTQTLMIAERTVHFWMNKGKDFITDQFIEHEDDNYHYV